MDHLRAFITFVIACLITVPVLSISLRVRPDVMHTFNAG